MSSNDATTPLAASLDGAREEFEKWAKTVEGDGIDGFVADFTSVVPPKKPKWKVADEYCSDEIQAAWMAWQASRSSERERVLRELKRIGVDGHELGEYINTRAEKAESQLSELTELLRESFVVLESLRISIKWELNDETKRAIADAANKIEAALRSHIEGK